MLKIESARDLSAAVAMEEKQEVTMIKIRALNVIYLIIILLLAYFAIYFSWRMTLNPNSFEANLRVGRIFVGDNRLLLRLFAGAADETIPFDQGRYLIYDEKGIVVEHSTQSDEVVSIVFCEKTACEYPFVKERDAFQTVDYRYLNRSFLNKNTADILRELDHVFEEKTGNNLSGESFNFLLSGMELTEGSLGKVSSVKIHYVYQDGFAFRDLTRKLPWLSGFASEY